MAIKVVKEIPKPVHEQKTPAFSYTEKVLADITEAYENRISKFELIGYDNQTYLASCTHTLADKFAKKVVYTPVHSIVVAKLRDKFKRSYGKAVKYINVSMPKSSEPAIKVSGVTVDGEKHVFVEINFDYIDNLETYLYDTAIAYYRKAGTKAELKERLARETKWEKARVKQKKILAG
jgi:hypothetical protein